MTTTERLAELAARLDIINAERATLREEKEVLLKERRKITTDQHRKVMRKRKLAYISTNSTRKGYLYGTKVRLMHHTRKGSRYPAGVWVARKADEGNSRKWIWHGYNNLAIKEPGMIAINRTMASMFS